MIELKGHIHKTSNGVELSHKGHTVFLKSGTADTVKVYLEKSNPGYYVFSENKALGYMSLELYDPGSFKGFDLIDSIFVQDVDIFAHDNGYSHKQFRKYSIPFKIKFLTQWF